MSLISILGALVSISFLLALSNGLKRYTKNKYLLAIAKQHRLFGMLAAVLAVVHMSVAVFNGELRLWGSAALISLFLTASMGALFGTEKKKVYYQLHRAFAGLTLVLIVIHVITNGNIISL